MPRLRNYKFDEMAERAVRNFRQSKPQVVSVDTETEGLAWSHCPFCATFSWYEGEQIVNHYVELGDFIRDLCASEILHDAPMLVGHNMKFDLQKLLLVGLMDRRQLKASRLHDTYALAHLLDEHRKKGLKYLAQEDLGVSTNEDKVLSKTRSRLKMTKDDGYHRLPREVVVPYALKDTEYTLKLYHLYSRQLAEHSDLVQLYGEEMELMLVLLDMEAAGLGVDLECVTREIKAGNGRILATKHTIEKLTGKRVGDAKTKVVELDYDNPTRGGKPRRRTRVVPDRAYFNPGSPSQVLEVFASRGIVLAATDKAALADVQDPLAEALRAYREDAKLVSTYLEPMRREQVNGVLHPNYRQHGTTSGRMSSGAATA